jgi:general secretion pathway protein D
MEVDADKQFEVGVEWATNGTFSNGKFVSGFAGSDGFRTDLGISDPPAAGEGTTVGRGFTLGVLKQGINIGGLDFANIGAVLRAFQSDSDVNVIATPQILTMDNKKATISVGENVPFITSQNTTAAEQDYTQFEYKDVATKLSITPHINQSDVLRLEIETEVVRIKNLGIDGLTPTTFNRTASTTVILNDRSTVVIGGIIGHDGLEGEFKVPILGDIPVLGWFFRTKTSNIRKTNMFIFITPRIVSNPAEIAAVTLSKEDAMSMVLPAIQKELHKEKNLDHALTLNMRGYEKLQANDLKGARYYFDEALDIDPVNPFALINMGVVYEKEGKPKQALVMYQAVLSGNADAVADKNSGSLKTVKDMAQENIDRILETPGN